MELTRINKKTGKPELKPKFEKQCAAIIQKNIYGWQMDIMNIPKIYREAEAAYLASGGAEAETVSALNAALEKYATKTA